MIMILTYLYLTLFHSVPEAAEGRILGRKIVLGVPAIDVA